MISSDRFLPSKEDPGTGYIALGKDKQSCFHVSSATILINLDSMLGRSFVPGQPPFVNSVYGCTIVVVQYGLYSIEQT